MKHVFVRIAEGPEGDEVETCKLFSGKAASEFIENPTRTVEVYYKGARLIDSWVVPATHFPSADCGLETVHEAFNTLQALDDICDGKVSDLFATIFEAGYQLRDAKKNG